MGGGDWEARQADRWGSGRSAGIAVSTHHRPRHATACSEHMQRNAHTRLQGPAEAGQGASAHLPPGPTSAAAACAGSRTGSAGTAEAGGEQGGATMGNLGASWALAGRETRQPGRLLGGLGWAPGSCQARQLAAASRRQASAASRASLHPLEHGAQHAVHHSTAWHSAHSTCLQRVQVRHLIDQQAAIAHHARQHGCRARGGTSKANPLAWRMQRQRHCNPAAWHAEAPGHQTGSSMHRQASQRTRAEGQQRHGSVVEIPLLVLQATGGAARWSGAPVRTCRELGPPLMGLGAERADSRGSR